MGGAVHSWFNLKPSRWPGSVALFQKMNDYGIFCMECSVMVLADDPPPPPLSPCPYNFCAFCLFYWPPLMLCDSDVSWTLLSFSPAECWTVPTVCMLVALKRSNTGKGSFLVTVHANKTVFNLLNHSPAYLQYLVCFLCQSLVLPPLSLPHTPSRDDKVHHKIARPSFRYDVECILSGLLVNSLKVSIFDTIFILVKHTVNSVCSPTINVFPI